MDAYYSTVARYLGLTSKDLAELGNISDRHARYLLNGSNAFPEALQDELDQLMFDVDIVRDNLIARIEAGIQSDQMVFRNNKELRGHSASRMWPKRGHSSGAFVGPHRVAVIEAYHSVSHDFNVCFQDS